MMQSKNQSGLLNNVAATRRGFTLIELLVVVAIISLLVSILLPSLSKAKELAKQAVCASQMRQLGFAVHGYLTESDEVDFPLHYPEPYASWSWMARPNTIASKTMTDHLVWEQQGYEKTGDPIFVSPEFFYCPSLKDQRPRYPDDWLNWDTGYSDVGKVSYITYEYFGNIATNAFFINEGFSPRNVECPRLSEGVLFKDQANRDLSTAEITSENHPGGINIVYGDGHVEWKKDSDCELNYQMVDIGYLGAW